MSWEAVCEIYFFYSGSFTGGLQVCVQDQKGLTET